MIGRPSVMTDEILAKLKEFFLMGCTDEEACAGVGIARSTLSEFKKLNPDFSDNVHAWKQNPILKARFTVYNSLNDVKVAEWFLERKLPEEFSLNTIVSQNKFVQNNITFEVIDPMASDYEELGRQAAEEMKRMETLNTQN